MHTSVERVLHALLDLCDQSGQDERSRDVQLAGARLARLLPELANATQDDAELLHSALQRCATEGLLTLQHSKGHTPEYLRLQRIRLVAGAEAQLRQQLHRPARGSTERERAWAAALNQHLAHLPADALESLRRKPLDMPERSPEQLAQRLARAAAFLTEGWSLREASARAFWGHSKVLDGRSALVVALCGRHTALPVALQVHVPAAWRSVLLIENETSFIRACLHAELQGAFTALVFCSGFRGAAGRIRAENGVRLFASPSTESQALQPFKKWLCTVADDTIPVRFFGDLDYSGMAILRELRPSFEHIGAWQPGYASLLDHLNAGESHSAQESDKEGQRDPVATRCLYADTVLLPALREHQQFVDQEAFSWQDCRL